MIVKKSNMDKKDRLVYSDDVDETAIIIAVHYQRKDILLLTMETSNKNDESYFYFRSLSGHSAMMNGKHRKLDFLLDSMIDIGYMIYSYNDVEEFVNGISEINDTSNIAY